MCNIYLHHLLFTTLETQKILNISLSLHSSYLHTEAHLFSQYGLCIKIPGNSPFHRIVINLLWLFKIRTQTKACSYDCVIPRRITLTVDLFIWVKKKKIPLSAEYILNNYWIIQSCTFVLLIWQQVKPAMTF